MLNISVFSCNLEKADGAALRARATAILDKAETQRLQQFKHQKNALAFMVGRLMTKTALAERLNCGIKEVIFQLSDNGKPTLAMHNTGWHFSISHALNNVTVALAKCRLGVDIESPLRFKPKLLNNPRFFSEKLGRDLASRIKPELSAANYWTAMEAIVKLEDSSIFSERTQFNFLLDSQNYYPHQRNIALVNWLEDATLVTGLALEMPRLKGLELQFKEFTSGLVVQKPILACTKALNIGMS